MDSPKQQHHYVAYPSATNTKGDGFDYSALAMTLDVGSAAHPSPAHAQSPTASPVPAQASHSQSHTSIPPRAPPSTSDYVEPTSNQQGYAMYPSNTLPMYAPIYASAQYATSMPTGYTPQDSPRATVSSTIAPSPQNTDIKKPGPVPQVSPAPPPGYPDMMSSKTRSRAKRRGYNEEEDDVARPLRRGRGGGHLAAPRRSHQFFSRPLGKRLSNGEEYELMDFTLNKKIQELNVLKEAENAGLITPESFAQKQLQFLEAFPFE